LAFMEALTIYGLVVAQQSKIRRDTKKPSFVSQNLQSFESVEKWRES
jgi:hypothetical protein